MTVIVRQAQDTDKTWLHSLNTACVPAVNLLTKDDLWSVIERCAFALIAEDETGPLGCLTLIRAGTVHDSLNYQWFDIRGDDFLYVDRIMVAEEARGKGVGRILYAEAFKKALGLPGISAITCEINLEPFNGPSLAFHASLGFQTVGEFVNPEHNKKVCMLRRPVTEEA